MERRVGMIRCPGPCSERDGYAVPPTSQNTDVYVPGAAEYAAIVARPSRFGLVRVVAELRLEGLDDPLSGMAVVVGHWIGAEGGELWRPERIGCLRLRAADSSDRITHVVTYVLVVRADIQLDGRAAIGRFSGKAPRLHAISSALRAGNAASNHAERRSCA